MKTTHCLPDVFHCRNHRGVGREVLRKPNRFCKGIMDKKPIMTQEHTSRWERADSVP